MDKDQALEWARGLTAKQLVEFFYAAEPFCRFDDEVEPEERYPDVKEHLIVARVIEDDVTNPVQTWALDVVALDNNERWGPHETLHQSGVCLCGHRLRSWAKFVVCPICGAKPVLT